MIQGVTLPAPAYAGGGEVPWQATPAHTVSAGVARATQPLASSAPASTPAKSRSPSPGSFAADIARAHQAAVATDREAEVVSFVPRFWVETPIAETPALVSDNSDSDRPSQSSQPSRSRRSRRKGRGRRSPDPYPDGYPAY
jgi:hypothetical protein